MSLQNTRPDTVVTSDRASLIDKFDPEILLSGYRPERGTRPIKYEGACLGRGGPVLQWWANLLWLAYALMLLGLSIAELALLDQNEIANIVKDQAGVPGYSNTTVTVPHLMNNASWVAIITLMLIFALGWFIYGCLAACWNCQAVQKHNANPAENVAMPFPPLILSVWWSTAMMVLWTLVLAAVSYYQYHFGAWGALYRLVGFGAVMVAVIVVSLITTFMGVMERLRDLWDFILAKSKSPCYDC